jgi:hypothetical protein
MKNSIPACPAELLALDRNAHVLWAKLLKKAGVVCDQGQVILDKRGTILLRIGLPDLLFRLECQRVRECGSQDEYARARIWFHVAEACAPGDSIPDIGERLYLLNPWIVTAQKFLDPGLERLNTRKAAGGKLCANVRCRKGVDQSRASVAGRSKFCSKACRNLVARGYSQSGGKTVRPAHFDALRPA